MNRDENDQEEGQVTSRKYSWLISAGFILVSVGVLLMLASVLFSGNNSASSGIVIFIGPFPIVLGAGPDAGWLILIGVILTALSLAMFVLLRRKRS